MTFNENRSNVLRAWKLRIATISRLPGTKTFPWIARRNARSHYTAQRNDRTLPVRHKAGLEANTESSIWRKTAFLHNFTEFRPVKRDRWRAVHDKSIPSTTLNVVGTDVLSSIDRSTKSIFVHLLLGRFKGYTQFFFCALREHFTLVNFGKKILLVYEWKESKRDYGLFYPSTVITFSFTVYSTKEKFFFKTLKNHNESQIDNKPIREMAQLYKNNLYFRDIRKNWQIKYIFELYSSNSIRR